MQMRLLTTPATLVRWLAAPGLVLGLAACVVHDTPSVNPGYGYGYGPQGYSSANVSVGEPSPYYVSSMPPEPLYEQMSDSPGDGSVWIDGYWHWNGSEWVWVNGRWEREQTGYVYVEPNYDYVGEQFVYTPGYWSQPDRVPRGWNIRDHRNGRPTVVAPPVGNGGYRPPVSVGSGSGRPTRPPIANPGGGTTNYNPPPTGGGRYHPPLYNPPGGGQYRPPQDGTTTGTIGITTPPSAGGAANPPPRGGGTFHPSPIPTQTPGGLTWRPPARPPVNRPPTSAPGGAVWHPPAQPPAGGPIYTNPTRPNPTRPPPTAAPIWVNPNPGGGGSIGGGNRPPAPGGPIWHPAPGVPINHPPAVGPGPGGMHAPIVAPPPPPPAAGSPSGPAANGPAHRAH